MSATPASAVTCSRSGGGGALPARRGEEPQAGAGDDAESALAAGEQVLEPVHPAAVGEHRLDADYLPARRAVVDAVLAAGVGGDGAVSRAAKSTPYSQPARRAAAWTVARVAPAPATSVPNSSGLP